MLIEFLETGNGTVVVNSIQPQPIAGNKATAAVGAAELCQFTLPRDQNGNPLPGVYAGEVLFEARDTVTEDTYAQLIAFVLKRTAAGVSSVVNATNLYLNQAGTLAAAAGTIVALGTGDFSFSIAPGTANATNNTCMGVILLG